MGRLAESFSRGSRYVKQTGLGHRERRTREETGKEFVCDDVSLEPQHGEAQAGGSCRFKANLLYLYMLQVWEDNPSEHQWVPCERWQPPIPGELQLRDPKGISSVRASNYCPSSWAVLYPLPLAASALVLPQSLALAP